jgi:hypothetical protein
VRQSAADWLLDAFVRSVSPATLAAASRINYAFPEGYYEAVILQPEPLNLLTEIRDRWIKEQAVYHDRSATVVID